MNSTVNDDHLWGLYCFINTYLERMGWIPICSDLVGRSEEILREMHREGYWSRGEDIAQIVTKAI